MNNKSCKRAFLNKFLLLKIIEYRSLKRKKGYLYKILYFINKKNLFKQRNFHLNNIYAFRFD